MRFWTMPETKRMKAFNDNADSFETPLQKVQKKVNGFIVAFMMSLEKKDGKVLANADNFLKITLFEAELKKFIKSSGYEGLIETFISETPKLIKKTL